MIKQINAYVTDQQLKFLQKYSALHGISRAEVMRMAIDEFQKSTRNKEISKLKETYYD